MSAADEAAFAELARKISEGLGLRAGGLQGQVHPAPDRGAHARLRGPHLRRLPGPARRAARPNTSGSAMRSRSTSPGSTATPRPGTCSATTCCRGSAAGRRGAARVECGLLVGRGAVHPRGADRRPPRARRSPRPAPARGHRRDRRGPREPRARAGGQISRGRAVVEMPAELVRATSSRTASNIG